MQKEPMALDKMGNDTGLKLPWEQVHGPDSRKDLYCATAHIWIYNSKGEVLLQRRSKNSANWPDHWDISAAGHIDYGESSIIAALREIKEEIGIGVQNTDLEFIETRQSSPKVRPGGWYHDEFAWMYFLKLDLPIEKFTKQKSEVGALKWLPLDEFEREVHDPEISKTYVAHPGYYDLIIKEIGKML